ncbi:hypothetical protein WKR88_02970 [Trinickia caryophylli]|uniref:Uncharacterized protein n=1 Tax=Trinickia caryophylli TaxID=28094 RepID=A0A1X7FUN6_TRICW|nr:hypothetical protein [Trinickia caryophylli]PMS11922.1 hypothetical protein C0Z17_12025 [Trinickia caryophylli]TRX14001.1 hypothetical protein FNF07_21880 [Trinickia caryophylli]WQE15599.1 hypothetical protein U0034_24090 [Trinickia caryophylli]SMF58438.1 hypothetical protein SAMN06295900_11191 [Trinickia caryophylli]GLU33642.1 hypothetical protein Busp01_34840 [Trinickia caryophylli]
MATDSRTALPQFDRPFRLFAAGARVLAQNAAGKVIDIGTMDCTDGNACSIRLDVDAIETGPQPGPEQALRALAPMLGFDYLDGLFTSEGEARFSGLLDDLPHIEFTLGETAPRELVDRKPPELF